MSRFWARFYKMIYLPPADRNFVLAFFLVPIALILSGKRLVEAFSGDMGEFNFLVGMTAAFIVAKVVDLNHGKDSPLRLMIGLLGLMAAGWLLSRLFAPEYW